MHFKKLHPAAQMPEYATDGAGGFDLRTLEAGIVPARGTATFRTGLAVKVPDSHVMLLCSRSGHGFKNGLRLVNSVGVIDSDYTGELLVKLHNDKNIDYGFEPGDRIAQGLVLPVVRVEFEEVDELPVTERGANGFGSTGEA